MRMLAIAASAAMLATSFANLAAADPIADRKANMKARGAQMQVLAPIAQGKNPFDATAVHAALDELAKIGASTDVDALWPAGSNTGDTKSSPKIWEDMAGFKAAHAKFAADTAAAAAAKPADLAAFQAVFGPVAGNCGACHQAYRM
jgi:cytochrome c556